ncbi:hypothetical protein E4T56_gene8993 [Termitomyces sp. T112]|nr:hypothetical protein E4T56_gene8993 [Termitomyces sp. T112]
MEMGGVAAQQGSLRVILVRLDLGALVSRPVPWTPAHCPATPDSPKTPNAPPNFRPCPAPISVSPDATPANSDTSPANSDASPANSNSPLATFNAFPAATDTYPGSPEP